MKGMKMPKGKKLIMFLILLIILLPLLFGCVIPILIVCSAWCFPFAVPLLIYQMKLKNENTKRREDYVFKKVNKK